jgi:hypothetical protein
MNEDKYICPDCGSGNICKLSIIHRNGITSSEGTASQHWDLLGSNDVRINAVNQSKASESAAPPPNPFQMFFYWIMAEVLIFIGYLIIGAIVQSLTPQGFRQVSSLSQIPLPIAICLGIFIVLALFVTFICFKAIITYPSDKSRWNDSYHCQRCDSYFLLRL